MQKDNCYLLTAGNRVLNTLYVCITSFTCIPVNRFLIYLLFSEDASLLFGDLEFTDQLSLQCLKQCKSNGKCFIVCACVGGRVGEKGKGTRRR